MSELRPAESIAKHHYERRGWHVEAHGLLGFLLYHNNVRQAVEVKQLGTDTLSPEQVAAAEMLAIIGVESLVCIVEGDSVAYDVPIRGLRSYVESIALSEPRRAKDLGALLHIPRWTFEPDKRKRERKRETIEQSLNKTWIAAPTRITLTVPHCRQRTLRATIAAASFRCSRSNFVGVIWQRTLQRFESTAN